MRRYRPARRPGRRPSTPWPPVLAEAIRIRDGDHCVYCGNWGDVIDHVLPVSYGGPTIRGNGVVACRPCNYRKRGLNEDYIVRGFVYLARAGESLAWSESAL